MRILPLSLLAVLALPALAPAQDARSVSTRLTPPPRVGDFRFVEQRGLQAGSGGQLQYRSPAGVGIIANIHPVPEIEDCSRACDSVVVDLVVSTLVATPSRVDGGGEPDSVKVERDSVVQATFAGTPAYGRHLAVSWPAEGKRRRTDVLLYGLGSYLVEVRASSAARPGADSVPARFAREFVRLLGEPAAQAQACPRGGADAEDIKVSAKSERDLDELRARVAPLMARLGMELDPAVKEPDRWRSRPHAGWPAGIDYGPWARQASPGFVVGVQLEEKGGWPHYTVSARAVCTPEAADGDTRTLELSLELQTAKAVAGLLEGKPGRQ